MTFLSANRLNIWAEQAGDGPRLLAINGTGADLRRKPSLLDTPLVEHFSVAAYDQRGLGQSDKPDGPYSMADYADDAAGVMDALGWDTAHVIGVSFGGMTALEFACRHPDRIDKLVLCCTSAGGVGGSSYPLHEFAGLARAETMKRMIPIMDRRYDDAWAVANPAAYEAMLAMLGGDDPYADEPRRAEGARLQLQARAGHDVWDRLASITAETLICGGRHDGQAPPENQHALKSRISKARLEFFEGGHMFLQQDPAAYAAIAAFLGA